MREFSTMLRELIIRDARSEDLDTLETLRYSKTMHCDRLRDADEKHLRYLVAEYRGRVVGFGLLVFMQPTTWPKVAKLPQMIDLFIKKDFRSRGIGTFLIRTMEEITVKEGYKEVFAQVEPKNNARVYNLYLRLGYKPLQTESREDRWSFTDSNGKIHQGVEWVIDMKKVLV